MIDDARRGLTVARHVLDVEDQARPIVGSVAVLGSLAHQLLYDLFLELLSWHALVSGSDKAGWRDDVVHPRGQRVECRHYEVANPLDGYFLTSKRRRTRKRNFDHGAGRDLALASSLVANKWTYPTVSWMSLPKITSPWSSAPTVAIKTQDMRLPTHATPPRRIYQLVDKRVWDTSGSSYKGPALGLR